MRRLRMADVTIKFKDIENVEDISPEGYKLADEMAAVLHECKEKILETVCIMPFGELQEKRAIKLLRETNKKLSDLMVKFEVKISYEGRY
jgi:hypothetical protein